MAKKSILILGGVRSGKSHFAQELATRLSDKVLFVATGEALDKEMQTRIEAHIKARPKSWRTLEAPTDIGNLIDKQIQDAEVVIIDCLTLLLSNLLKGKPDYQEAEKRIAAEIDQLISCVDKSNVSFIVVSNEVGMGLVPENKLGRIYRDLLGKANQLIAQHSSEVYFMISGLPVKIKG